MKINSVHNTTFQSRNVVIRNFESAMRSANNAYPAFSVSKATLYNVIKKNWHLIGKLSNLSLRLTFLVRYALSDIMEKTPQDYYLKVLELLKQHKLANCLEHTDLDATILGMNNIQTKRATMSVKDCISGGEIYNHALTVIPLKDDAISSQNFTKTPLQKLKNILIYDSYCGFVDFPSKASERYKGEFQGCVKSHVAKVMEDTDPYFEKRVNNDIYLDFDIQQVPVMDKETVTELRKNHPELIFNLSKD